MISNDFKEAVENKKIRLIKIMLKDSLMIDPTGKKFDELFDYAQNNLEIDLLDKHDNEVFNYNKNMWNKKYFNEQMVKLLYNFSSERIDFLKEICKVIYADYIIKNKSVNISAYKGIKKTRYKEKSNNNIFKLVILIIGIICIIFLIMWLI